MADRNNATKKLRAMNKLFVLTAALLAVGTLSASEQSTAPSTSSVPNR
jgi:hypothetical protein